MDNKVLVLVVVFVLGFCSCFSLKPIRPQSTLSALPFNPSEMCDLPMSLAFLPLLDSVALLTSVASTFAHEMIIF